MPSINNRNDKATSLYCLICIVLFAMPLQTNCQNRGEKYLYDLSSEVDLGNGVKAIIYEDRTQLSPAIPQYIHRRMVEKSSDNREISTELLAEYSLETPISVLASESLRINIQDSGPYFYTRKLISRLEYSLKTELEIYLAPNTPLWKKEITQGESSDDYLIYQSGKTGSIVLCKYYKGVLEFYSNTGNLLKKHYLFGPGTFRIINSAIGIFSLCGDYFIFQAAGIENSDFTNNSAMYVFTKTGELLWMFDPPEAHGSSTGLDITYDGQYVLSFFFNSQPNYERAIYLHRIDGTLVRRFDGLGAGDIVISESNKYAALRMGNKMWLIDLIKGELAMTRYFASNGRKIWGIDICEELGVVAVIESRHLGASRTRDTTSLTNGVIRLIEYSKKPVAEIQLPDIILGARETYKKPDVSISLDGNTIGAYWGTKYYNFQRKQ